MKDSRISIERVLLVLLISVVLMTGCKSQLISGHYEGNLLQKTGDRWDQESVKIELTQPARTFYQMTVQNHQGVERLSALFHILKNKSLEIQSEFLGKDPIRVAPVGQSQIHGDKFGKDTRCYRSVSPKVLEFCHKSDRFLLRAWGNPGLKSGEDESQLPVLELSGNAFVVEPEYTLEEPVRLTLTESEDLAFHQNFESRIAYQQVLQARFAAVSAYLNLVPHLTTNLIWNAAPNYITYIATLQGLAPFLLPSYWLQARESSIEKDIQEVGLILMRANLASTVEELVYALKRDESIVADQRKFLAENQEFVQLLNQTVLPEDSRKHLLELSEFISVSLTSDIGDLEKLIRQDLHALAQTLGFHNLEAISQVEIDRELLKIDSAVPVDPNEMATLASQRSYELKQLDLMKKIIELKRIENFFIWMDPSGDPKQGLGFNNFPQQRQAKARLQELEIERDRTKTNLYQSAYKLALDYNEAIRTFYGIKQEVETDRFDFHQLLAEAESGQPVHSSNLKWLAQKHIASRIANHVTLANFRIARAKKDRFLLAGYYSQLLPRLDEKEQGRSWGETTLGSL